jgi:hypothetical protein
VNKGCDSNLPDEQNKNTKKMEKSKTVNIGTWNVRTLKEDFKLVKLLSEIKRLKIDILGVSETHWTKEIEESFEEDHHVVLHSCRSDDLHRQGVAIILSKKIAECMTDYELISERIMSVTLELKDGPLTLFQVYAPDTSYSDVEIDMFYEQLQDRINLIPRKNNLIILGDFNAKIGHDAYINWPDIAGRFTIGSANASGETLLQFCAMNDLGIMNTFYQHKKHRLVTWTSPDGKTQNQIDFFLIKQSSKCNIKNCRVYNSADIGSDHSLLLSTCVFELQKRKVVKKIPRKFNIDRLKQPEIAEDFQVKIGRAFAPLLDLETNVDELYESFKNTTNKITKEVVGYRKSKQVEGMSAETSKLCEKRRAARIEMIKNPRSAPIQVRYRNLNKQVKAEVKKTKQENLEKKVTCLEEDFKANNSRNLFKTVRELEGRPKKSLTMVKDKQGKKHSQLNEVMLCWEEHFKVHLNTAFPHDPDAVLDIPDSPTNTQNEHPPTTVEIIEAVKSMKRGKAPGIDEITSEVIKMAGEPMIRMLEKISKQVWNEEKSPKDWSRMLVSPIHKKGDKLDPANYRAISLLSIPGKVFLRVLLNRMRNKIEEKTKESQYGFRPGRGTVDAIFIVRQVMQKARERKIDLHFNFVDFKAAFDTVWRKALWKMLRSIGIGSKIVNIIEQLYDQTECVVVINGHITQWFTVTVGVRQGCLLSPILFNIFLEFVMNELQSLQPTLKLDQNLSTDIRYADDTTLISAIFNKLGITTNELEASCQKWGMKVNSAKCNVISNDPDNIQIDGENVKKVQQFVFLGSVVPGTTSDVKRRIGLASSAFGRLKEKIWSNRKISIPLKIRLFYSLIVPIAIYASETWTLIVEDERRLNSFEMKCLRSILGVSLRDRLRNQKIRQLLNVDKSLTDMVRKKRMQWFGHVVRLPKCSYVNIAYKQDFDGKRPKGRPPKRWSDQLRLDTGLPLLTAEKTCQDREKWRKCIMKNVARLSGVCN